MSKLTRSTPGLAHLRARLDGVPQTAGRDRLLRYFRGERITAHDAIAAKCCDCMGGYRDGRQDCKVPSCPLYPWMPYREDRAGSPVADRNAAETSSGVVEG